MLSDSKRLSSGERLGPDDKYLAPSQSRREESFVVDNYLSTVDSFLCTLYRTSVSGVLKYKSCDMKKLFYKLHLWLGLVSGLLVFVIALTGALYAFQAEISSIGSYRHVTARQTPMLPPSQWQAIAEQQLPGKKVNEIRYDGPSKAVQLAFYGYNPTYYYIVFLDPYTGNVRKVKNMDKDFFRFVMRGHFYLWLPPAVGQPLVAGATLLFLLVVVSGLVIWIPRNAATIKNRLLLRWKKGVGWPRVNYDLHVVGGVYATLFALIFALTGLVWGFPWFAQQLHRLAGGQTSLRYNDVTPYRHPADTLRATEPIDRVWLLMRKAYPDAASVEIRPPRTDTTLVVASASPCNDKYWKTDYRYFDRYTLKEVKSETIYGRFADTNAGDKLLRMNYDLHTGAILGLPGKIIAFLASLFIAGLPLSGFIIWWRRRKKRRA
ncbi:MAG: PepSY-associated helix domain protein [Bacteroidetes bacterium]|nr:PepSY-associated helix domain protein [Bacteroidota bacterium]